MKRNFLNAKRETLNENKDMKTFKYISSLALALAGATLALMSCADEWDNHYNGHGFDSAADAPSLLELVKADKDLSEFLRVAEHVGYDKVLSSPQSLTLWAPIITSAQADSIINLYDEQKRTLVTMPDGSQRNTKDKDNTAITQFMQNHMALYGRSVSSVYEDSIRMMNGKYMVLSSNSLNGVPFLAKNIVASNGVMYKLGSKETFFPNVREAMALNSNTDSLAAYYRMFDVYELDESSSVQMGVVDGEVVYADSVTNLSNLLYDRLGFIQREDSAYMFIAPTTELWKREYEKYSKYFNYVNKMENRDSVAALNADMAIIRGRVFNLNQQHNNYEDSLINTSYINNSAYYGLNVFQNPKAAWNPETNEGILNGLEKTVCSNGLVYIDNEGRIDPKLTFMQDRYILGTNMRHRGTPRIMVNSEPQAQVSIINRTSRDSIEYNGQIINFKDVLQEGNYVEIAPENYQNVVNRNSSIYFYLPNTLSGVYYNVYVVMVPAFANNDGYSEDQVRPTRFNVYRHEREMNVRSDGTTDPNEDLEFARPNLDNRHILSLPEGETHGSGTNFETTGNQVDVICIDKAFHTSVSGMNAIGTVDPALRYRLTTAVRASEINNNLMTNIMRINRIIYIAFETEEEAKAYQLDLSNINEYREQ